MANYVFPGMAKFVEDAAAEAGHDVADANGPYHLLVSAAKSNPALNKLQNALGQLAGLTDAQKASVLEEAERMAWAKQLEADAANLAVAAAKAGHKIKTTSDKARAKAEAEAEAAKLAAEAKVKSEAEAKAKAEAAKPAPAPATPASTPATK